MDRDMYMDTSEKSSVVKTSSLASLVLRSITICIRILQPSRWRSHAHTIFLSLLPSYLSRRVTRSTAKEESLHQLAALDGLRGLACLFVFNEHYSYNFSRDFLYGYGIDNRRSVVQWPFIRVFWSGFSMVATFYVISGYVLSYKPLKQIRSRSGQVHETIASSIFRRALRLYVPTVVAIWGAGLATWMGLFNRAILVWDVGLDLHESPPQKFDGFFAQMSDTATWICRALSVWSWDATTTPGDYDLHLWTIPVEFRCSMVLFLMLIGTSRLQQRYRLATVAASILYCIGTNRKDVILFLFGMLLAEVDMIRNASRVVLPKGFEKQSVKARAFWLTTFIIGLYLLSAAVVGAQHTWGFQTLGMLVPSTLEDKSWAMESWGAILTTWAVANCEDVKPLFTNAHSQYLGKISFALYLVHGNVLKSLLYAMMPDLWDLMYMEDGEEGEYTTMGKFVFSWLLGMIVVLPVTLWVADVFWRLVDIPSVKFAKWLEGVLVTTEPDEDVLQYHEV